jgi:hypothetical protein
MTKDDKRHSGTRPEESHRPGIMLPARPTGTVTRAPSGPGHPGHLALPRPAWARPRVVAPASRWPLASSLGPLGAVPTVARLARTFTVTILITWGLTAVTEAGELIVGELAANVLRAAAGPDGQPGYDSEGRLPVLWLRLRSDLARLQVEVWDNVPVRAGTPAARHAGPEEESGRGLHIVDALSQNWGWDQPSGGRAKRVWALLSVP